MSDGAVECAEERARTYGVVRVRCTDARSRREVGRRGLRSRLCSGRLPAQSSMASVGKCRNCSKTVYQLEAVTAIDKVLALTLNLWSRIRVVETLSRLSLG